MEKQFIFIKTGNKDIFVEKVNNALDDGYYLFKVEAKFGSGGIGESLLWAMMIKPSVNLGALDIDD